MVSCNTTLEEQTSMFADSTRLWDTVTHTQYYSHRRPSVLKGHLPPCRSRRVSSLRPHIGRRSLLSGLQTCDALSKPWEQKQYIPPLCDNPTTSSRADPHLKYYSHPPHDSHLLDGILPLVPILQALDILRGLARLL